jgi:hypothetical protein
METKILYINSSWKLLYKGKLFMNNIDNYQDALVYKKFFASNDSEGEKYFTIIPTSPKKASDDFKKFYFENINSPYFSELKLISGKNLAQKTHNSRDSKYGPERFERNGKVSFTGKITVQTRKRNLVSTTTGERITIMQHTTKPTKDNYKGIFFWRSMERSKGISTIHNLSDKQIEGGGVVDEKTASFMASKESKPITLDITPLEYIERVRGRFKRFRELFKHIKEKYNLTNSQTNTLFSSI